MSGAIRYVLPEGWIVYDRMAIFDALVEAKSSVAALKITPYQRDWVEKLQAIQLKMEVAGTSRIEGADFTDRELDAAMHETGETLQTRSQRQAKAAADTYRWIADLPDDRPLDEKLICDVHRRIVTGCDDDHCEPGRIRRKDHNVTFGVPPHRGCNGGAECSQAFSLFANAIQHAYKDHDPLIQAIAIHYHFAAMHPFGDGNGRTARALEALVLQRAGLRDTAFIAMSNYYYEEKLRYMSALAEVRQRKHDLTPFVRFALEGVAAQCKRLLGEIKVNVQKAMFRNTMFDLFGKLKTPRKRVIAQRQLAILKLLLGVDSIDLDDLIVRIEPRYGALKDSTRAIFRDLNGLIHLGAVSVEEQGKKTWFISANLDWPAEMKEGEFVERFKNLPRAKTSHFI